MNKINVKKVVTAYEDLILSLF